MAHDVFISFATEDKHIADAMVHFLERSGVRCWIAPRDAVAGAQFGASIIDAINSCELLILILSSHSNGSEWVTAEVERAASKRKVILPVRVEDVRPSGAIELYIAGKHWLDAIDPPMERHLEDLSSKVRALVGAAQEQSAGSSASAARSSGASSAAHAAPTQTGVAARRLRVAVATGLALAVLGAGAWWTFAKSGHTTTVAGANSTSVPHSEAAGAPGAGAALVLPVPEVAPESREGTTRTGVDTAARSFAAEPDRSPAAPEPPQESRIAPALTSTAKEPAVAVEAPESSERDARSTSALDARLEAMREELRNELRRCTETMQSLQSDGEARDVLDTIFDRERALSTAIGAARDPLECDAAKAELAGLEHDVQARRMALTEAIQNEQRNLFDAMNQLVRRLQQLQPIVDERGTANERQSLVEIRAGVPALDEPGRALTTLESQTKTANRHIRQLDELEKSIQARSKPVATDVPKPAATTLSPDPAKYTVQSYSTASSPSGKHQFDRLDDKLRERGFSTGAWILVSGTKEKKKSTPTYVVDKDLVSWLDEGSVKLIVVPIGTPESVRDAVRAALNEAEKNYARGFRFEERPASCRQTKGSGDLSHHIDILSLRGG